MPDTGHVLFSYTLFAAVIGSRIARNDRHVSNCKSISNESVVTYFTILFQAFVKVPEGNY